MILSIQSNDQIYEIDSEKSLDISIPLYFNSAQPNAYGVETAQSKPCEAENLIGDTRRGGSCNFEQYTLIPHCNGTHTECVGHITHERISVHDCLKDVFIPATLISVAPEKAGETQDTYLSNLSENDLLITRKSIEHIPQNSNSAALIIRTLPNDEGKLTKTYTTEIPPFFSTEAMQFIVESNVKHLLVDMPSIDRIFDEGKLSNHRIFWNVEQGAFAVSESSLVYHTITELIYVPDKLADGNYLLNLQIAAFVSDASPSRPILFQISK